MGFFTFKVNLPTHHLLCTDYSDLTWANFFHLWNGRNTDSNLLCMWLFQFVTPKSLQTKLRQHFSTSFDTIQLVLPGHFAVVVGNKLFSFGIDKNRHDSTWVILYNAGDFFVLPWEVSRLKRQPFIIHKSIAKIFLKIKINFFSFCLFKHRIQFTEQALRREATGFHTTLTEMLNSYKPPAEVPAASNVR